MIVVGGGVIGLTVAYALHRAGHEVTVFEAETVGSGSSRGNAGWFTAEFGLRELCERSLVELRSLPVEVHDDGILHVDPLSYCETLAGLLPDVREHTPVRELPSDPVVVAAGVRSGELVDLELEGVKGYSIDVPLLPGIRTQYLHEHGIALTAFPDRLRIAGFFERGATHARPDKAKARELVALASEALGLHLDDPGGPGWAGLRPTTPDGRPRIERLREDVYVAAGHGMLGVTLAPLTGALIAGLVRDRGR